MAGRPTRLTDELEAKIVAFIHAGGTPRASAVAAGVPADTFDEWRERGAGRHPRQKRTRQYARFARRICEAIAQVQVATEIEVRRTMPLQWLRCAARDIWTESTHVAVRQEPAEEMVIRVQYVDAGGKVISESSHTAPGPRIGLAPLARLTNGAGHDGAGAPPAET